MKKQLNRKIAMFMTFIMIIPLLWNMNTAVARAATPTFAKTSIEIVGVGNTYNLDIKDKVANSKYSWSSSDIRVAKVTSKGVVTAVDKGFATIKCKITYPSKKTKTLSCKVTVTIPATDININNHVLVNGAHVMKIGDTMDFNCDLTPVNSSDLVFWSAKGDDPSCIRVDNDKEGRITAVKAGKAILVATAAKTADAAAAKASIVNDAVIIEVVGPTATVNSADFTASNQITVVFDSPVNPSTVIGDKGVLSNNIAVSMSKDIKGVVADDPGKLTASISSDNKTLTILSEKPFRGDYIISFSSDILTMDGIHLESYYKRITYTDSTPPAYAGCTTDDTGRIATIHFTEPINFSKMKISNAAIVTSTGETASQITISTLNNVLNYTASEDKTALVINLSNIPAQDFGKRFSIIISGITDLTGNPPAETYIQATIFTDVNKPQARLLQGQIKRTGYNTVTATFDRSIQFGGYLSIEGGPSITGVVDTKDSKKVNYTISPAEALYTGFKSVTIGYWRGYNVNPLDKSAETMTKYMVDFTQDVTAPFMLSNTYDTATGILTLVYNEPVNVISPTGAFSSTFTSLAEDIIPLTNINYTTVIHSEGANIVKLKLTGISQPGSYRFTVAQGFVTDSFNNASVAKELVINNAGGESTELAPPYSIAQNADDLNIITVRFMNKLDSASALNVNNYKIPGVVIQSAVFNENQTNGATVLLTVADGSIKQSLDYPMTISGIKGFNNSFTEIIDYKYMLPLKENVKPTFTNAKFDAVTRSVTLNFSEAITGTMTFRLTQTVGAYTSEIPVGAVNVNGSSITITFTSIPYNNTPMMIYVLTNNITDVNGNKLNMPSSTYVMIN